MADLRLAAQEAGHKAFREVPCGLKDAVTAAINAALDAIVPDPVLAEITTERRRQIEVEGWTPYHDDEHGNAQLARAAAAYALNTAALTYSNVGSQKAIKAEAEAQWPWAAEWWKPTTPRRDLIKAAALIVAEIERLDRAKAALDD